MLHTGTPALLPPPTQPQTPHSECQAGAGTALRHFMLHYPRTKRKAGAPQRQEHPQVLHSVRGGGHCQGGEGRAPAAVPP